MSEVGKWESGKLWFKKNRSKGKNNSCFSCTIQEKFVPLQHSCKTDKSD